MHQCPLPALPPRGVLFALPLSSDCIDKGDGRYLIATENEQKMNELESRDDEVMLTRQEVSNNGSPEEELEVISEGGGKEVLHLDKIPMVAASQVSNWSHSHTHHQSWQQQQHYFHNSTNYLRSPPCQHLPSLFMVPAFFLCLQ